MADEFFFDTSGVTSLADDTPEVRGVSHGDILCTTGPEWGDVAVLPAESFETIVTGRDEKIVELPPAAPARTVSTHGNPGRVLKAKFAPKGPLYLDLETIPDYSREDKFGLPPLPEVPEAVAVDAMPSSIKTVGGTVDDIKKVLRKQICPDAWLDDVEALEKGSKNRSGVFDAINDARNARQSIIDQYDERRKLLSTTPEFCKIAAVGWAVGNHPAESIVLGHDTAIGGVKNDPGFPVATECDILNCIWRLLATYSPVVIFNGLHFDLPVIFVRSAILGIASSRRLDLKPWGNDVVDPYAIRFGGRGGSNDGRPRKLKSLAPLYGLPVPAGDCDGSLVEEMMKTDPAKVGEYVRSDVEVLRAFHQSLAGYFWA
jgi:hypothetical protein